MMPLITVDELKKQARIDGTAEDDLLELYCASAEATVFSLLNRTKENLADEYGGCIPEPVKHAALMLAAHNYTHREPASPQNLYSVPYTIDALIKPYMTFV